MTMHLALVDDDGTVLEDRVVEGIDEYNLDKALARASVVDAIQTAVALHRDQGRA